MRALAATALLLTALLAGCAGDEDPDGGATPSPSHDDLASDPSPVLYLNVTAGNGTQRLTSGPAAGHHAGHGNATSGSASGTTTPASGNATTGGNATGNTTGNSSAAPGGPAPLNVTFELGASRLPAGTAARWSFDFGEAAGNGTGNATGNATAAENGTTLPATLRHIYNETGEYDVTFTLRAGNLTPQTLRATVRVGAGGNGTAGGATADLPFSAAGTITVGTQGDGVAVFDGCGFTETVDMAEHPWDLTAGISSIQKFVVHMDLGSTNADSDIYMYDPAGTEIGSSVDFNVLTQSPTEDFEVEGPLVPGVYTFKVVGCTGVEMEYSIAATATVLTA